MKIKKYGFGGVSALRGPDGNVMNEPAKADNLAGQPIQTSAPSTYNSIQNPVSNSATGFGSNQSTGLLGQDSGATITINNTQTPPGDIGQQDPGLTNPVTAKKGKMIKKLSTGGLLRQGKPKLALRGWK
jgi:hypothetical protein